MIGICFSTLPTNPSLMTLVGGDEAQNINARLGTGWVDAACVWVAARALTWMLEWDAWMSSRMRQMQSGIHMLRHHACVQPRSRRWPCDMVEIGDVHPRAAIAMTCPRVAFALPCCLRGSPVWKVAGPLANPNATCRCRRCLG